MTLSICINSKYILHVLCSSIQNIFSSVGEVMSRFSVNHYFMRCVFVVRVLEFVVDLQGLAVPVVPYLPA